MFYHYVNSDNHLTFKWQPWSRPGIKTRKKNLGLIKLCDFQFGQEQVQNRDWHWEFSGVL